MKKSIAAVCAAFISLLFFAGCGSTKINLSENSPMVLASVIGNSAIPWTQEDPYNDDEPTSDGILTNTVNKLLDSDNPEMMNSVDRLDYAVESFSKILPEMTGCEVLPNDEVIKSDAYLDLKSSLFNVLISTKYATGHKDLTTFSGKNAAKFMSEVNAKSLAVLTFTFEKMLSKGNKWNGECQLLVTMNAKVLNEKGRELVNKDYTSQSQKSIKIRAHKYDKQELADCVYDEIDNVIRVFASEFMTGEAEATSKTEESDETVVEPVENVKPTALPKPAKKAETENSAENAEVENPETETLENEAATETSASTAE